MSDSMLCCAGVPVGAAASYCTNCDLLLGLDGLHVTEVERWPARVVVTVESPPGLMGCPTCGVVAVSHGRRMHHLIDAPCFGRPVLLRWRKRTWSCPEPSCGTRVFTEQDEHVAASGLSAQRCFWPDTPTLVGGKVGR